MSRAPRFRPAPLRTVAVAALLALAPICAGAETAGTEIFTVDTSDGYGIDACLASGASCGQAMADAWCRVHAYERAVSFGKVTSDANVGSVAGAQVRAACYGSGCAETVAITCGK